MNIGRRIIVPTAVAGAVALSLVALSACSSDGSGSVSSDGKLKVTASFYPMQYLAEEIGGSHVSVTNLTKPGVEPHDLELTPQQTAALGESDVIVYLKSLMPAVDDAVAQSGVKNVADVATFTTLEDHGTEVGHDHGSEEEEHSGEEGAAADPHVWLDPVRYAEIAEGVEKTLAKADPDNADTYAKNTDALVKKLDALNTEFEDGLKNRTSDTFITTHAAFGYLAERYGLTQEAISGLDPESEPSAARMKELQEHAKEDGVTTIFFETLVSDKTAKTLAGDLGLKTDVLDPIEGITAKSKGEDYIEVMQSNLKALQTALGAK